MYTFYNDKYNNLLEKVSNLHIPDDFKYGFLKQTRVDDIVGKSETDIGPSDNTWHHFTHVWDGSRHHIYYDGELYSQGPDSNVNLKTVANGCVFGSREQSLNFQGDIKGIEVYAEALNANQIKHILGNLFYFLSQVIRLNKWIYFILCTH